MATVIGPTPPGTGVIQDGALGGGVELHVAAQLAVGRRFMPTSMTTAPGRIHSPRTRPACPRRPRGCPRARPRAGPGEAMADGRGRAGEQQLERHRPADDVGGADHHRVPAAHRDVVARQQAHHARGRAGAQQGDALGEPADVVGMEAVDVLGRVDGLDDPACVELRGERQLDQDAVDGRVLVEPGDQGVEGGLAGVRAAGHRRPSGSRRPRRRGACCARRWRRPHPRRP
jgi:hypothetical protein